MRKNFVSCIGLCVVYVPCMPRMKKNGLYSIKGQVIDSLTNETVPYATLSIAFENSPQESVKLLACDIDGKFETSLNSPGKYIIFLQSVGKNPAQKTFSITDDRKQINLGTVYMTEDQQRLVEVTVTAQKLLVKVEIDKLTYSMEDDPEAQTNSTLDMLRKVPMVTVNGDDEIQLKGSGNYKIYLNGKPSNMLSSNNASDVLKSMPASSVKHIEVITDPGAKYDAEGVGGIINIITTKNALQGYTGNVRAGASTLGRYYGGAYLSTKVGNLGVTGNYNYHYQNMPWNDLESFRESYETDENPRSVLSQNGRNRYRGPFQYGSLEATYEIDSLNLLSLGANIHRGNSKQRSEVGVSGIDLMEEYRYRYDLNTDSRYTYGAMDMNLDYQHSTSKPDELLTVSYRFSHSPSDNDSYIRVDNVENYEGYIQKNINDASTNEHTAQIDYTTPFIENHTVEVGAKYIMRQSKSHTDRFYLDGYVPDEVDFRDANSDFRHTQHIYSAYLGYAIKYKSFGFKTGVRAERTALNVRFAYAPETNFDKNYYDVVPNGTVSYQINMAQQIRLGYNMRIYRPGIWHLNPYIDQTNPDRVSYGNPLLNSEKSHGINLNYSMFTQKFNLNASASYRFVNNAIVSYTFINTDQNGRTETTFDNMGKNNNVGMFLYARWNPIPLFNVYMNGGIDYTDIDARANNMSNSGFSGRLFAGSQIYLPKDFRVDLNGGFFTPWIELQTKRSTHYFTSFTLNKEFLDKKLTVSLAAQSPFWKTFDMITTTKDETFFSEYVTRLRMRDFQITVTYRFGTLKDSIKKSEEASPMMI